MREGKSEPDHSDFDTRLKAARTAFEERGSGRSTSIKSGQTGNMEGLGDALRIGTELVAAIGIGFGIGYGLDSLLDTKPVFMILFLFLGGAAGVLNVYKRAIGLDDGVGWRRPDEAKSGDANLVVEKNSKDTSSQP